MSCKVAKPRTEFTSYNKASYTYNKRCNACLDNERRRSLEAQAALVAAADAQPPILIAQSSLGEQLAVAASHAIAFIDLCIQRGHKVLLTYPDEAQMGRAADRLVTTAKELSVVAVKYQAQVDLGKLRASGDQSVIREILSRIEAEDAGGNRSPDVSASSAQNFPESAVPRPKG